MTTNSTEFELKDIFEALGKNDTQKLTQILEKIDKKKLNELTVPQARDFGNSKGANPPNKSSPFTSIKDSGMSALHLLCLTPSKSASRVIMLKALLEHGADPNVKCLDSQQTPLFFAVMSESVPLLRALCEKGGDVHYADENGNTLLHCAAQIGVLETVKFLLEECKVDMNRKNKKGWLPYHVALSFNQREVLEYLLEKGQDVNADLKSPDNPNEKNQFPIFILAKCGHLALAKWLVEKKGMDACPPGIDLQPSKLAQINNHAKLSQFLLKYKRNEADTKEKEVVSDSKEEEEIMRGERCANCKKKGESKDDLKNCGRCQKIAYCSRECQVAHWKSHKLVCQAPDS